MQLAMRRDAAQNPHRPGIQRVVAPPRNRNEDVELAQADSAFFVPWATLGPRSFRPTHPALLRRLASALQETGNLARSKDTAVAKPIKHGDKWRIRWIDEKGKRQSAVFDDYKGSDRAEPAAGRGRGDQAAAPNAP